MRKPQSPKYTWWEKTVEYSFILGLKNPFLATPLAGSHEERGDLSLSWDNYNWLLIEFKRDSNCLVSERKKYNWECASTLNEKTKELLKLIFALRNPDTEVSKTYGNEPHYFVYATGVSNERLLLQHKPYWGKWIGNSSIDWIDSPGVPLTAHTEMKGWEHKNFNRYVKLLLKAKSGGESASSAGGYDLVLGLSKDGNGAPITMTTTEYVSKTMNMVMSPSPPTQTPTKSSTPRMR